MVYFQEKEYKKTTRAKMQANAWKYLIDFFHVCVIASW